MSGLKNTQAIAIIRQDKVPPTIKAKRAAANEAIPPRSQPTRGIQLRRAITGANKL